MSWLDAISNDPVAGQPVVYSFTALAGQSTFSGLDRRGLALAYTPGPASVLVLINGRLLTPGDDFIATDGSSVSLVGRTCGAGDEAMVVSFNVYTPADTYSRAEAQTAFTRKRNRIVNPGMRISQELGANLVTLAGAQYYPVDQFSTYRGGSTGNATAQQVASVTPGGSSNRLRVTVTAANATPAAGDLLLVETRLEGFDVADLRSGSTAAKIVTLRLGVRSSVPGTFGLTLRNGGQSRSNVKTITIAANEVNVDVVKTISFDLDQTGSWATDNGIGMYVSLALLAGSTFSTAASGWQNGNFIGVTGQSNLMATNGSTFDMFDVGLYEGTVVPPFEMPHFAEDLRRCQRYWSYFPIWHGRLFNANGFLASGIFFEPMRVTPSVIVPSGAVIDEFGVGSRAISSAPNTPSYRHGGTVFLNLSSSGTQGAYATLYADSLIANARL